MVALLDVDMKAGNWRAEFLHSAEWTAKPADTPRTQARWRRWLAPAIEFQAMRGGGIFIAAEPT